MDFAEPTVLEAIGSIACVFGFFLLLVVALMCDSGDM